MSEWKFDMEEKVLTKDYGTGEVVGLRTENVMDEKGERIIEANVKFYLVQFRKGVTTNNKWFRETELKKMKTYRPEGEQPTRTTGEQ